MRDYEVEEALTSGASVRGVWAFPSDRSHTRVVGKVVAYSLDPMVLIESPEGERVWWGMNLVDADVTEGAGADE